MVPSEIHFQKLPPLNYIFFLDSSSSFWEYPQQFFLWDSSKEFLEKCYPWMNFWRKPRRTFLKEFLKKNISINFCKSSILVFSRLVEVFAKKSIFFAYARRHTQNIRRYTQGSRGKFFYEKLPDRPESKPSPPAAWSSWIPGRFAYVGPPIDLFCLL